MILHKPMRWDDHLSMRRLSIFLALSLVAAAFLLATGLSRRAYVLFATPTEPWRTDLVGLATADQHNELVALREREAQLHSELLLLRQRLRQYEEIGEESGHDPDELVLLRAPISARSNRRGHHFIEIARGGADRVRRGMAVTLGWSLIGVVAGEAAGHAPVRLLQDKDSRLPARLVFVDPEHPNDPQFIAQGVIAGSGDPVDLQLLFVQQEEGRRIEPGMEVHTASGFELVPEGLLVGMVSAAEPENHSDHWSITVRPLRRVSHVSTVLVLKDPTSLTAF